MSDGRPTVVAKLAEREPDRENPWGDDSFGRQSMSDMLSSTCGAFLAGTEGAAIALNGGYGTGKTFVLHRWIASMQADSSSRCMSVYYNAWENDDDDDPLVSLIESVASDPGVLSYMEGALKELVKGLSSLASKYAGVDFAATVENVMQSSKQKASRSERTAIRRDCKNKMKESLAELVSVARKGADKADAGSGLQCGLIVVVDDLDRCKPDFAMSLLHRVKHVMNVAGVVFVFGVDLNSLRKFVNEVYGDIDAHGYLLRMFDDVKYMPERVSFESSGSMGVDECMKYLSGLIDRHKLVVPNTSIEGRIGGEVSVALRFLGMSVATASFTPREINKAADLLMRAAWACSHEKNGAFGKMYPFILIPVIAAKIKDPGAYERMVSEPDGAAGVLDCAFGMTDGRRIDGDVLNRMNSVEIWLYKACRAGTLSGEPAPYAALRKIAEGESLSSQDEKVLSRRFAALSKDEAKKMLSMWDNPTSHIVLREYCEVEQNARHETSIKYLAKLLNGELFCF